MHWLRPFASGWVSTRLRSDAIAPVVSADSIDYDIVFRAARYGKKTMHRGTETVVRETRAGASVAEGAGKGSRGGGSVGDDPVGEWVDG